MEKGLCKTWTLDQEELWARRLRGCRTFAERHLTMSIRDLLKYDARTREGKRAIAQSRLRLATATNEELQEIARLEVEVKDGGGIDAMPRKLQHLKQIQAHIKEMGIKRSKLECQ